MISGLLIGEQVAFMFVSNETLYNKVMHAMGNNHLKLQEKRIVIISLYFSVKQFTNVQLYSNDTMSQGQPL